MIKISRSTSTYVYIMKNKKNINKILIIILFLSIIIIWFIVFKNNTWINNDINLFNSLNKLNNNLTICNKIENKEIKEKCNDNYYSIKSFEETNEDWCNKIISTELKALCIKSILKFK